MINAMLAILEKVWHTFLGKVIFFTPRLMAALVVIAVGIALGLVIRKVSQRILHSGRFDTWVERMGVGLLLRRAGLSLSPGACLSATLFWVILACAAMLSLTAFELPILDRMATEFFLFLPRLAVAILIMGFGFLLAGFLARAALLAAVNAELPAPRVTSTVVRFLVIVLSSAMALEQVGVATAIVSTAFAITFGGLMLGLALAFGLGGRRAAQALLDRGLETKDESSRAVKHF
ncbi:MAG: hypothetical protein HY823_09610 [Acidobacteria bacterium]|nr:hypothetical protein [Acidobacteriota bacterium]